MPSEIVVRQAGPSDLHAVLRLLEENGLPPDGIAQHFEHFKVACETHGGVLGCVGLELHGSVALLRSLAVDQTSRGHGIGTLLVDAILVDATRRDLRRLCLLTTSAADYFRTRGFVAMDRLSAPRQLLGSEQFKGACPASATFMSRTLGPATDDVRIRRATGEDAEAIHAIYAPLVRDTVISFEIEPPSVDDMRARIERTLASFPWWVSLDGAGAVNGYAYAGKHREREAYAWSVDTTIYVRADARGRGVGSALYERLLDSLAHSGYAQAFAGITLPNDASVRLHESVGFEPVGVYRRVGFKHGEWRDVGWWGLQLREGPPVAVTRSI